MPVDPLLWTTKRIAERVAAVAGAEQAAADVTVIVKSRLKVPKLRDYTPQGK